MSTTMRTTGFYLLFLFILLVGITFRGTSAAINYPHCYVFQSSPPHFQICWNVDGDFIDIQLQIAARNTWFAFGIGEPTSGSMPGADMVTVEHSNGQLTVTDRYATAFVTPSVDACQDWEILSIDEESLNGQPITAVQIRRALSTGDTQDRPITAGENHIVWAYGTGQALAYHGPNRGVATIDFLNPATPAPTAGSSFTYTMPNIVIPAAVTTYMCSSFTLPPVNDSHIIRVDPILDASSASFPLVHHFLVHICDPGPGTDWTQFSTPQSCYGAGSLGDPTSGCTSLLYAWAVGGGPLLLPAEAGVRMGSAKSYGMRYGILEVHYDNPKLLSGIRDSSGIKITYTSDIRKYDAGILDVGDVTLSFPAIPPGLSPDQPEAWYQADCPSQCTQQWTHDILVYGDLLHMHQTGARMWDTHWAANPQNATGSLVGTLNSAYYYQFSMQQITYHSPAYVVSRGDRLSVNCVFDTTGRSTSTKFGPGSEDEMCLHFLFYYPLLFSPLRPKNPYTSCGSIRRPGYEPSTFCGDYNNTSWLPNVTNPAFVDPLIFARSSFGNTPQTCPLTGEADGSDITQDDGFVLKWWGWVAVVVAVVVIVSLIVFLVVKRTQVVEYIGIGGGNRDDDDDEFLMKDNSQSSSSAYSLSSSFASEPLSNSNKKRYGAA